MATTPRPITPADITAPRPYTPAVGMEGFPPPLDPTAVEAALRTWMSHVDYDTFKLLECDEDEGKDRFPELAQDFITYYTKESAK